MHVFLFLLFSGLIFASTGGVAKDIGMMLIGLPPLTDTVAGSAKVDLALQTSVELYDRNNANASDKCKASILAEVAVEKARLVPVHVGADQQVFAAIDNILQCKAEIEADCDAAREALQQKQDEEAKQQAHNANNRAANFRMMRTLFEDVHYDVARFRPLLNSVANQEKSIALSSQAWLEQLKLAINNYNLDKARDYAQMSMSFTVVDPFWYPFWPKPDYSMPYPNFELSPLPALTDPIADIDRIVTPQIANVNRLLEAAHGAVDAAEKAVAETTRPVASKVNIYVTNAERAIKSSFGNLSPIVLPKPKIRIPPIKQMPDFEEQLRAYDYIPMLMMSSAAIIVRIDYVARGLRALGVWWRIWWRSAIDTRPVDSRAVMKKHYKWNNMDRIVRAFTTMAIYLGIFVLVCLVAINMSRAMYQDYHEKCVATHVGSAVAQNMNTATLRKADALIAPMVANTTINVENEASMQCADNSMANRRQLSDRESMYRDEREKLAGMGHCRSDTACTNATNVHELVWTPPPSNKTTFRCQTLLSKCDLNVKRPEAADFAPVVVDLVCGVEGDVQAKIKLGLFMIVTYFVSNVLRVAISHGAYLLTLGIRRGETTDMICDVDSRTGRPVEYCPRRWVAYLNYLDRRNKVTGLVLLAVAAVSTAAALSSAQYFDSLLHWAMYNL